MPTEMQWLDIGPMALLGLMIGSFLNVLIHRLPRMMERQWAQECAEMTGTPVPDADAAPFNLVVPRSRCPHCGHPIAWYENIPVLSYLVLRGKCSACHAGIGLRYPLVELTTSLLFGVAGALHGATGPGLAWAAFAALLVALFLIDFDTQLLPDDLNYLLLWLGLVVAALGWGVPLPQAVWGRWPVTCRCGACFRSTTCSPARSAWAMGTSSCWRPWGPGLAPTT